MNSKLLALLSLLSSWIVGLAKGFLPDMTSETSAREFLTNKLGPTLAGLADVTETTIDNTIAAIIRRSWEDPEAWPLWWDMLRQDVVARSAAAESETIAALAAHMQARYEGAEAIDPSTIIAVITAIFQLLKQLFAK